MSGNGKQAKKKISRKVAKAISRRIMGKGAYGMYAGMPLGRPAPIRGKGGFWGDLWGGVKKFGPAVIGAAGSAIANPASPMLNAYNGWMKGRQLSQSLGWGAYRRRVLRGQGAITEGPDASISVGSGVTLATPVPGMHSNDESVRVHKVEYLGDVITSSTAGAFSNRVIQLNPGICFYWGSKLAALFQQYRLEGAMVYFKSRASSYTANTTLGTVMICMDYNPHNEPFSSKQQMQETTGCVACSVDQNATAAIECDPKMTLAPIKYVRTGEVPLGEDKHLYDWGTLQIATSGSPAANANVGELYVSYDITYFKPKPTNGTTSPFCNYYCMSASSAGARPFGSIGTNWVTPLSTELFGDTLGIQIRQQLTGNANEVRLPPGTEGSFMFVVSGSCVGTACGHTGNFSAISNCTASNILSGTYRASSVTSFTAGETITKFMMIGVFKITEPALETIVRIHTPCVDAGTTPLLPAWARLEMQIMPVNTKLD